MKPKSLSKQGRGLIFGLAIQFLLGMAVNLYVAFPEDATEATNTDFASHNLLVIVHALWGLGLLIGAGTLIFRSKRQNDAVWLKASSLGGAFILLAASTGYLFVSSQNDIYSYLMSIGFLGAFLSYGWGILKSGQQA
jgi:hypothetical protein